ncbi:MAG TPA: UDP-N-acetylmuramoyl-L-alanyl-D-glutamate--2,6-diaminopimelate ligase [Pyrinomonadaceae bacterium]|nr:UDP-N-acetylmuramoyl-L-alanyl-D-glutamate--2,6-diaminopimelate ligase [Pyrinomonadaceae bacterium]
MDIKEIAELINAEVSGNETGAAHDITHDSRQVREGTLFVAIKGSTVDGHRFLDDVLRRGAPGIISESDAPENFPRPWLKVENARAALAIAAAAVNGSPSHQLDLVGITGTNGKTTTTYLCRSLFEAAGKKAAMLTTVEYRIGDRSETAVRTTPEASDTNRFLRQAVNEACSAAVMEASSQAIDLHRCDALLYRVAVFTNLTRDHLDYHGTMENYFDAKKKLFDGRLGEVPGSCVINVDDDWGVKLANELGSKGRRILTFSLDNSGSSFGKQTAGDPGAEFNPEGMNTHLSAANIEVSLLSGTSFLLRTPLGDRAVESPLIGRPHVYNILAATAVAIELGCDLDSIKKGISACTGAPGRFERVPNTDDIAIVVDYAHTDDALLNTLATARELAKGRIITVFGCGGDRDKTKRPIMGRVAGAGSDLVVITSDNPRTEDPLSIIHEVEKGVIETGAEYMLVSDRREAIFRAVEAARTNDVVLIAGKGHETYQIIGSDKFDFDDRIVAAEALAGVRESS